MNAPFYPESTAEGTRLRDIGTSLRWITCLAVCRQRTVSLSPTGLRIAPTSDMQGGFRASQALGCAGGTGSESAGKIVRMGRGAWPN
jgi:hypothetical protein